MNIYQTISSETMEKVGDTFSEKRKKEYVRYHCTWNDIETYWNVPFSMREGYSETEEKEQIPVFFQIVHAKSKEIVEKTLKIKSFSYTTNTFSEEKFACNDLNSSSEIAIAFEQVRKNEKTAISLMRDDLYFRLVQVFTEIAPKLSSTTRKQVFLNLSYISSEFVQMLNAGKTQFLIDSRSSRFGKYCEYFWSIINQLGVDLLFFEKEDMFSLESRLDTNAVRVSEDTIHSLEKENLRNGIVSGLISILICIVFSIALFLLTRSVHASLIILGISVAVCILIVFCNLFLETWDETYYYVERTKE